MRAFLNWDQGVLVCTYLIFVFSGISTFQTINEMESLFKWGVYMTVKQQQLHIWNIPILSLVV